MMTSVRNWNYFSLSPWFLSVLMVFFRVVTNYRSKSENLSTLGGIMILAGQHQALFRETHRVLEHPLIVLLRRRSRTNCRRWRHSSSTKGWPNTESSTEDCLALGFACCVSPLMQRSSNTLNGLSMESFSYVPRFGETLRLLFIWALFACWLLLFLMA